MAPMQTLPIHDVLPALCEAVQHAPVTILQAPPGAGKTTVVPLELLGITDKTIIMLEPRRLAARHAAQRMADLLEETPGERVGYRIRMERRLSRRTRIEVVTEGILTRLLQRDPALEHAGIVIFDEFHERSLHADLALALTLQSQALLRPDLKLLIMSATLDTQALQHCFPDAPVITSEGRSFPVVHRYLDPRQRLPEAATLPQAVCEMIFGALKTESTGILTFLPGGGEIRRVERLLRTKLSDDTVTIAPLYGAMDKAAQHAAIVPAPAGRRKIVLATNIAETSLTIDGIGVVIDAGLARISRYESDSGMSYLRTEPVTRDAADQRSGRAGRTAPGVCYRLWHEQRALKPHGEPEMLRADLAPLMLELAAWGTRDPEELQWLDLPPTHAVEEARALLQDLGLLEAGQLTASGRRAHALGMHPRLAAMLLRAQTLGLGEEACLLAAMLEEHGSVRGDGVDLGEHLVAAHRCEPLRQRRRAIRQNLGLEGAPGAPDPEACGVLCALAYPDRIARRRDAGSGRYLLANGKGATLRSDDPLFDTPCLAVAHVGGREGRIFLAAPLERDALETHFKVQEQTAVTWNPERLRVEARRTRRFGALVLESSPWPDADATAVAAALCEGIREQGIEALPWSKESRALQRRVGFVHHHDAAFDDWSDAALLRELESWLQPHLEGISDLGGLKRLDLIHLLRARLPWEQQQRLDRLAPPVFRVPSGSNIRIDYSDPDAPVLAVKLQEMFGLQQTPRVMEGRVALLIHLLSPAGRPVQMTRDLVNFWKMGYADVRKELRGRYSKHYWPEDPFTATATRHTKPRP